MDPVGGVLFNFFLLFYFCLSVNITHYYCTLYLYSIFTLYFYIIFNFYIKDIK